MPLRPDVAPGVSPDAELRRSEERFQALMEHTSDAMVIVGPDLVVDYASPAVVDMFGYAAHELVGQNAMTLIHPEDHSVLVDRAASVFHQAGARDTVELRALDHEGQTRWVELQSFNLTDDPRVGGVVTHVRDVSRRRAFQDLSQRLMAMFESTPDIMGIAGLDGRLQFLNHAGRAFIGLDDNDELTGTALDLFLPPGDDSWIKSQINHAMVTQGTWSGEVTLQRHDGSTAPMVGQLLAHRGDTGRVAYFSGLLHDISDRKAMESRLAHQATHDPLTGLPNRTLLMDRLEHALARAHRTPRPSAALAVLFCDLDHFKVVNDSMGHSAGDQLLLQIAERIGRVVRPGDTVGRFGGDEFVVLCEDLDAPGDATTVAERIIDVLTEPFTIGEAEVFIGVSIGIAVPESIDADPGTLVRDADAAMYRAKARGRARWERFDHAMRASAVARLDTENALRRSVERRELRVVYQPIISLAGGGHIVGVEALLRWEHPERGLLGPADFIRVAEETGLIVPIGTWVLNQACRQTQRWRARPGTSDPIKLAVNLSGRQLAHPGLVDDVAAVIHDTGIEPSLLEFEITESVLMDDVEASADTLARLKALGVRLAVDDFGTGYSSLAYLRQFPVDVLKVDRSFISELGGCHGDDAIVAAIITLAHTLGLQAVAEGVETPAQLSELRQLGCDHAQGYWFSRPIAGTDCADLLATAPSW